MAHFAYSLLPLRRPRNLKRQRWISGVGFSRGISRQCNCGKQHSRQLSLCLVLPRHRFGSSRFNTLILLFLRLFYHASSFELTQAAADDGLHGPSPLKEPAIRPIDANRNDAARNSTSSDLPILLTSYKKLSTHDWLAALLGHPNHFQHWKVCSITWVKALASPFSHEFIQFIVEDFASGQRTRIAAGREENGDWVLVGWNWASGDTPSDHYNLPLPLLTVTFDDPATRPDMLSLSQVLAATTRRQPDYKFSREMCWWYAESVLDEMHAKYGGTIKEWQWSRYRYSFIVKTSFIRRKVLTKHAEAFRKQLAEEMSY
ncbi:uncharacterized protein Z518_05068 [Rhinocladiella mackenziei CBS 650.93]|uniref:Uncharacterized protein n=1 Tax=Rhinocladiella mackenziei CBS 650.93 TaxID=1442369 RepID=A0A0D2IV93_9EURO|nr:uncharacterized protein Z518_05068 [Rhinocladiella mackenziei CBS 650.93]KIX07091.1 hypothetical protein Z518_05068 [Rhinocladiella mackenziei CBS 650.93]